jgi:hypothetical protein
MSAQCPTTAPAMKRPSTQSPFARSWRYLHRGDVFRPLGGSYPSVIAPTDSCADPSGSPLLRLLASFEESVQVTTNPRYPRDLPDVILRIFLQMPEPLPRRFAECVCLVLPQHSSAFPRDKSGRRPAVPREHDFPRIRLRGCSYFFMFRPPRLLAPQIVPTAANTPAGRPRLLRPSRTCVVAFARIGYTIHLTTGNWRNEDFHLARFSALSAAPYLCRMFSLFL